MNYLKQIISFHNWLETNQLDPTGQALWFHLMNICNKCGWAEWFSVANMVLQGKLGIDRKTLGRKRHDLVDKGLILYENQGRKAAGKYKLLPFRDKITGNFPAEDNITGNIPVKDGVRDNIGGNFPVKDGVRDNIGGNFPVKTGLSDDFRDKITGNFPPLYKQNYITKQNKTKEDQLINKEEKKEKDLSSDLDLSKIQETNSASCSSLFLIFENEFGKKLTPIEVKQISGWQEKFGPELTEEALRRSVLQGKLSLNYIGRILSSWEKAGLRSIQDVLKNDPLRQAENATEAAKVVQLQSRRQEERIRAACDFITLQLGPDPPREQAEEIAIGYKKDDEDEETGKALVSLIMDRLYGGGP